MGDEAWRRSDGPLHHTVRVSGDEAPGPMLLLARTIRSDSPEAACMSVRNLEHLLRPASVALIGASNRPGSVGAVVARNLFRSGFSGPVMPVNPRHRAVEGVLAYPDVPSLPLTPDLAVICTPPPTVPGLVADLGPGAPRRPW